TPSTDLYACGVVLFHVLTGKFPVDGGDFMVLPRAQRSGILGLLPADLVSETTRQLYLHLVAKNPSERIQRADEALDVVESVLASHAFTVDTERPIAIVADADEAMRTVAKER